MLFSSNEELINVAKEIHENAVEKGFWDNPPRIGESLILILDEWHELYEATEDECKKIPGITEEEEEAADMVIRSLDYLYWSAKTKNLVTIYDVISFDVDPPKDYYPTNYIILILRAYRSGDKDLAVRGWRELIEFVIRDFGKDRLEIAIRAKMEYNKTRPRLHGKLF